MKTRGIGFVFLPRWKDRNTGEIKTAKTWAISFNVHGKQRREYVHSTNRADAVRLLKQRIGDVQAGKPVGPEVERTTLAHLLNMVEADYKANGRRSLQRMQFAAPHLRNFLGNDRKAREITSDALTAYAAHRLDEKSKPSTTEAPGQRPARPQEFQVVWYTTSGEPPSVTSSALVCRDRQR